MWIYLSADAAGASASGVSVIADIRTGCVYRTTRMTGLRDHAIFDIDEILDVNARYLPGYEALGRYEIAR